MMTETDGGVKVGQILPKEVRALLRQARRVYLRVTVGDWPALVRVTKRQARLAMRFQGRHRPLEVAQAGDSLQIG